jgi:general secretion pathway protein F
MPTFRYAAIDTAGQTLRGAMEGPDEATVVALLRRQGHLPMRVEAEVGRVTLGTVLTRDLGRGRELHRSEVMNFTRELATMLTAGQDLDRALRYVVETAPNRRVRAVMESIRGAVRDGAPLATALARYPRSFSPLYTGMVRAGEAGAQLAAALDQLAGMLERQQNLTATVISALIYPTLLVIAAIGSITLMLTHVLPQFVPLFEQNGAKLPRSTQILISAGDFLSQWGLLLLVAFAAIGVGVRLALRNPHVRLSADRLLLRVPIAGRLARDVVAARFTRTFGTLLANGVPLITALSMAADAVGNRAAIAAIELAAVSAKGGGGLADPLERSHVFPARALSLLRLGEENATLGAMSLRAAEIHDQSARLLLQRLVALLVPVITIVMGAAVAAIVATLLLAILSLNELAS